MFYTSRGRNDQTVQRQRSGHASCPTYRHAPRKLAGYGAYAIRLLPPFNVAENGSQRRRDGLLVADNAMIKRLNGSGADVATWDFDPSGTQNDENALADAESGP